MAEARAVVESLPPLSLYAEIDTTVRKVQARMTSDGFSFFVPHPRYLLRSALRSIKRLRNKMQQVFVPVPLSAVVTITAGALAWLMTSKSSSWIRQSWLSNFLWKLDSFLPWSQYMNNEVRVAYLTLDASALILGGFTFFHRMLLRFLLSYTGWMDEGRGKRSWQTRLWGVLLKYVYMRDPKRLMLAHQTSLPKLPLPSIEDTVRRYKLSMEAILTDTEKAELAEVSERFLKQEGPKFQRILKFRRFLSTNWISDWWLDFVYLRGRDSIMINSNYYGLSLRTAIPTNNQAARAANAVYHLVREKLEVDHEVFPPMVIQGVVPICMDQYTRAFSLTREPGVMQDRLVKYDSSDSRHIVILCRGHFFKLRVFCDLTGRQLSRLQLECAIKRIIEATPSEEAVRTPEAQIGALTAINRTEWAQLREQYFLRDKLNRNSLEIVERSLFFLCLDDIGYEPTQFTELGHQAMHGRGHDRWFDKSFNVIISKNGYFAINGEHSWGDAPAIAHLLELFLARETREVAEVYNPTDGSIKPTAQEQHWLDRGTLRVYHGERILFNIPSELQQRIHKEMVTVNAAISDFDLAAGEYLACGKGAIKDAGCSPDGFIQMALQLAWYRQFGSLTQTYESAMTRMYLLGRTETIRSATSEAAAWVTTMEDPTRSREDKVKTLHAACENHARLSALAMTGRGIDRHLFGLYVVSVGTKVESPFLQFVYNRKWRLSTSQIPPLQTVGEWATKDSMDRFPRACGGFGPVADDGYGVCYSISGEKTLFFHVSSKHSCPQTSSKKMLAEIYKCLDDMFALFSGA